jgi:hypothetical protein
LELVEVVAAVEPLVTVACGVLELVEVVAAVEPLVTVEEAAVDVPEELPQAPSATLASTSTSTSTGSAAMGTDRAGVRVV